jgi:leucyl aminopeptidase
MSTPQANSLVSRSKLDIRLRVLIPAAENNVAGNAFRPGDVLTARNGLTSEIANTDAEGRLVLADALVAACEEAPDLIIDAATLTGAARVALGTDLPAIFTNDDGLALVLDEVGRAHDDAVWRLPLFRPYAKNLKSKIADMKNVYEGGAFGGAITAALYLQRFLSPSDTPWVHMDFMGYTRVGRAGSPEGGEAQGMRALFHLIRRRFSS